MKSAHWSATPPNQEQGIAYVHLSCEIRSEEFAPHILPDTASKTVTVDPNKAPEDMTVEELQLSILAKMANNGPVSDQMKKTVNENIWHDSLVNWLKSFR